MNACPNETALMLRRTARRFVQSCGDQLLYLLTSQPSISKLINRHSPSGKGGDANNLEQLHLV
jgi:hypothetical protein